MVAFDQGKSSSKLWNVIEGGKYNDYKGFCNQREEQR
jgi:hypothetical protein